jgi:cell division ATPase FtsA
VSLECDLGEIIEESMGREEMSSESIGKGEVEQIRHEKEASIVLVRLTRQAVFIVNQRLESQVLYRDNDT